MTRVLMTADTVGGVWTYALELADALAAHDVEVSLATMGRPLQDWQWEELERSSITDVHQSGFALEWMDEPWADVDRAAGWLLDLEDEVQPDVVHLNGYAHGSLPWRAPTVVVAHSCVLSWWEAVHGEEVPPTWEEYRRRVVRGIRAAGTVVAPTAAMLGAVERWYGVAGGVVVPNCRARGDVPTAAKEPFVLGAGRLWDDAKNLRMLADVADRVAWPVRLAGDAGDGIHAPDVELLGLLPTDELRHVMARASIFCEPARYEPFGLSALEAGLAGCALVLGDIPSLREVWGDAAVYVDPADHEALVAALDRLTSQPAWCEALGRRARLRAAAYTPARAAEGYLAVYEGVRREVRAAG
jgi:glycogen(starch) synthase